MNGAWGVMVVSECGKDEASRVVPVCECFHSFFLLNDVVRQSNKIVAPAVKQEKNYNS